MSATLLQRDSTARRDHVHVWALSEIFVTDAVQSGDEAFSAAFQLPRSHTLWADRSPSHHDPLVILEVGRQAVFLLLHRFHDVPVGWKFILRRADFRVIDLNAFLDDHLRPPEGELTGELTAHQTSYGVVEASFFGQVTIGAKLAMVLSADLTVVSPYNFKLLRAKGRGRRPSVTVAPRVDPVPVPPKLVGRSNPRNVVLYEAEPSEQEGSTNQFGLIVDETHPGFFDHPHDHVTGSLILELFRQAATAAILRESPSTGPLAVTGCSMEFDQYAELDSEILISSYLADFSEANRIGCSLELAQFGETISSAQMELCTLTNARCDGDGE
jgi:A-factor biosynthesis hotdog domain